MASGEELRREVRIEAMHEIIPLVCGSCGAGLKPEKVKTGVPPLIPNSNWYHKSGDGESTWTCFAGPILNILEREGGGV